MRRQVRAFIEELLEEELAAALGRSRYEGPACEGWRNGHRERRLSTTFGPGVWRCHGHGWSTTQVNGKAASCCGRLSRRAELLIAQVHLVRAQDALGLRALKRRELIDENIVRLILDGTVVKVRLDRQATALSLLIVLGIRRDGQKVLTSKNMDGESEAAGKPS